MDVAMANAAARMILFMVMELANVFKYSVNLSGPVAIYMTGKNYEKITFVAATAGYRHIAGAE
jgi:hypothetical protein